MDVLSLSSGWKNKPSKKLAELCFHAGFLLGFLLDLEDGGDMFLGNDGSLSAHYTALYPRR
jgi:hypothetical protein